MDWNGGSLSGRRAVLSILVLMLGAGCTAYMRAGMDGRYDDSNIHMASAGRVLEEVIRGIYRIETSTAFRVGDDVSNLRIVGIAFSVDANHLLTAKHVTRIEEYPVRTPFGLIRLRIAPEDKIREVTSIVEDDGSRIPLQVIYRDDSLDFAVLKADQPLESPRFSMGSSEDFRVANLVILPSNFQTGWNIRMGHVTQLEFVRYGEKGEVSERNPDIFGISAVVSEGDSGSPILLVRDGKVELGGIVSFIVLPARGLGYGLKIDPVMERLKARADMLPWVEPLLAGRTHSP